MSIRTPRAFSRQVKAINNFGELNRWATDINDTVSDSVSSLNEIAVALRRIMNTTTQSIVLTPHGSSHLPLGSDPLATAAPAFTFTTAAAVGAANSFVRSDASLAIFDTTVPAGFATAAATGSAAFAARRDHVHQHPAILFETTRSSTLTFSSPAIGNTQIASSLNTLRISAATAVVPGTDNGPNLGTATLRWKSLRVGTSASQFDGDVTVGGGLSVTGTLNLTGTVDTALVPTTDANAQLGEKTTPLAWLKLIVSDGVEFRDVTTTTKYLKHVSNSSTALTADRTLTFDVVDASRTLKLTGNPTLADWFDQNVKTTGTPQFARTGIGQAADGTVLLAVNDAVAAPTTNSALSFTNRYGGDTNYCGDPNAWLRIRIGGSTYKIPCYS